MPRETRRHLLLEKVVARYVGTHGINGLDTHGVDFDADSLRTLRRLVRDGLVQVVSDADYPNPAIRPWASRRSRAKQAADLGTERVVLYPTPRAMAGRPELGAWPDQPFRTRLLEGQGTLDLAYFTVDVLEHYRNDPRYHFRFGDFEVELGIGDDAYQDDDELDRDKIGSVRVGFAYDTTTVKSSRVRRYACSFVGDLAKLTPAHQQRWRTYEVEATPTTKPHPVWFGMQMGHWPDGLGPFDRILAEVAAINALTTLIYGEPLFDESERPREWGWVLRPSTQEWHQFLMLTNKILAEALRHSALTKFGVARKNTNNEAVGTLARLEWFLRDKAPLTPEGVAYIVDPMHKVRKGRQTPAHELVIAMTDPIITAQQRDLLAEIVDGLGLLRTALVKHPHAAGWVDGEDLDGVHYRL